MYSQRYKHLIFTVGSRHPAVRSIKEFLNKYPLTNSFRLTPDLEFDSQTQAALMKYQTHKRLETTGEMDIKTWAMIGAEMNPIDIQIVSAYDLSINKLLNHSVTISRVLSVDEIKLAQTIYKSAIDYSKVKVHQGKYFDLPFGASQPDDNLMTPNGEIYAPAPVYKNDFALESADWQAVFIHEMCHVWQYQRNIKNIRIEGFLGQVYTRGHYDRMYKYTLQKYIWGGTTETDLKDYALEQQAVIIEDYFRVVLNNFSLSSNRTGQNCQNTQPLNEIKELLKSVLKRFLANPAYLGSV